MKYIYVNMVKAKTTIGSITRFFTRYPFSHVSISLDDKLEEFYSFSRYYYNSPLISGFNKEYRNHLAAKKNSKIYCRVYKIPVTNFEYNRIKKRINKMKKDKELMYNYYSLITMKFLGGIKVYKSYTCCSFVAEILSLVKSIKLFKSPDKFFPKDFDKLLGKDYKYEDKNYEKIKGQTFNFYKNVPFLKRMKSDFYVLKEATHRLIFKTKSKNYNFYKFYISPYRLGNTK